MTERMSLAELGERRAALREELRAVTEDLEARALEELAAGKAEAAVAREAQVDRMTVRKWQGKR